MLVDPPTMSHLVRQTLPSCQQVPHQWAVQEQAPQFAERGLVWSAKIPTRCQL